ncbi:hypothetical protein ZOSMA_17G00250 [Zostera marina]|uniref:U3 small nucleolar RNA-associated protein n=1 Tax=Zostera marina TaxID=29655 RepID=A0A0K9PTA3_ZOSMR|nr:hypothetical protein ZOSMA_17G00250 [Zostera marina]
MATAISPHDLSLVKFNHDAQILAILSSMKTNSLKLVHIPSFTVYSNFLIPNANLKFPKRLDFSPGRGFMAVGNAAGNILLYKLHHFCSRIQLVYIHVKIVQIHPSSFASLLYSCTEISSGNQLEKTPLERAKASVSSDLNIDKRVFG